MSQSAGCQILLHITAKLFYNGNMQSHKVVKRKYSESNHLQREQILQVLARIGRDVARLAEPSYYSHEQRDRALGYASPLEALREAYRQINNGAEPLPILYALKPPVLQGIEANFLRLLIGAAEGDPEYIDHPSILSALKEGK